jgi:hypothetical protein
MAKIGCRKNQGPALQPMAPQKSPAAKAGVNIATKTSGSFGKSSEGNVSGKGTNKQR